MLTRCCAPAGLSKFSVTPPDPAARRPCSVPVVGWTQRDQRTTALLASILTDYVADSPGAADVATKLGRSTSPSLVDSSHRRASSKTQAITELVDILDDLGFEPEPAAGRRTSEIRLRHCPFQDLAERHGEVICSLHLGLMQGALGAMRAPVTVDRLDPFVEPDLCVARLAPAATSGGTSS